MAKVTICLSREKRVQRWVRLAGWVLLGLAVAAVAVIVPVGAFRAHTNAEFNRWIGWAAIAAVPLTALGVLLLVLDKLARKPERSSPTEIADSLAARLRAQWTAEAVISGLNDPYPLPVSWTAADPPLAGDWKALTKLVTIGPAWSAAAHEAWATKAEDLAGGGARRLADVLATVPTGRLVVLGEPGTGKTMLMVGLVLDLLHPDRRSSGGVVPVLATLASWDPVSQDLHGWLGAMLITDYPDLAAAAPHGSVGCNRFEALLAEGLILPILDGLDEIPEAVRPMAITRINRELRPGEGVVITCRTEQYQAALRPQEGQGAVLRAGAVQLSSLEYGEVAAYLRTDAGPAEGRWEFLDTLDNGSPVRQALATPLMAGLARTIYNPRPGELVGALPDPADLCSPAFGERAAVESRLLDAFIPAAYRHAPACRWTAQNAERWLVFLARHLERTIGIPDLAWWQVRQAAPRTPFRFVFGLGYAFLVGLMFGLAVGLKTELKYGFVTGLMVGFFLGLGPEDEQHPPVAQRIMAGFENGFVFGLVAGLVTGLVTGLAGGLAGGLAFGLVFGLWGALGGGTRPGEWETKLVYALVYGVLYAVVFGLVFGLVYGLVFGLRPGLIAGLVFGLAFGFWAGFSAWLGARLGPRVYLVSGLVFGLAFGLVLGLGFGLKPGLVAGLGFGLAFGLGCALGGGFGLGLRPGLGLGNVVNPADMREDLANAASPQAALARDKRAALLFMLKTGLITGLAFGFVAGFVFGLMYGLEPGLVSGLGTGLVSGLIYGLFFSGTEMAWPSYILTRGWLASHHHLPWSLMSFLADAHRRGLLRQAGAVYQFRHIELQRRLAIRDQTPTPQSSTQRSARS